MTFPRCVLLGTILLLVALLPVEQVSAARGRSGGHSYPSSRGGLSGHGSSGSHSYPSSGNHGYPSNGGGLSGNGGSRGSMSGSHGYPASPGLSGNNNGYPGGKNGMSGNSHTTHTTTNIHNNYHYSPPQQIRYTPAHGGAPVSYPVYHGTPPTYVYQYQNSGSKYGTLLAGLALFNLGALAGAGTAYAIGNSGHGSHSSYKSQPGEVCQFGIKKDNGDYEATNIDCQLITSFIYAEEAKSQNGGTNTSVVTTTVTNVTMVNTTGGDEPTPAAPAVGNVIYSMLPNGTLIPLNGTENSTANATTPEVTPPNGVASSVSVTTTTTNTTVVNAVDVKGKAIDVTPGMQCYVIRKTPTSSMKKTVPCGLLQTYAQTSLKKNSASRNMPVFTILAVVTAVLLVH